MPKAHVIVFCLVVIGAYGALYAIHAGRGAAGQIYDLESRLDQNESQISDLENEAKNIKSVISDLEYRGY